MNEEEIDYCCRMEKDAEGKDFLIVYDSEETTVSKTLNPENGEEENFVAPEGEDLSFLAGYKYYEQCEAIDGFVAYDSNQELWVYLDKSGNELEAFWHSIHRKKRNRFFAQDFIFRDEYCAIFCPFQGYTGHTACHDEGRPGWFRFRFRLFCFSYRPEPEA